MRIDSRLKIAYLLVLGAVLFGFRLPGAGEAWLVGGAIALQVPLALLAGLPLAELRRVVRRLFTLFAILTLSYAVVSHGGWRLGLSLPGALIGILMCGKILALLWGSVLVQKTGEAGSLVRGLIGLGLPRLAAMSVDLTLSILASSGGAGRGGGGGRGDGSGGGRSWGRGRLARDAQAGRLRPRGIRDLLKGDLGILLDPLRRLQAEAERHAANVAPDLDPARARDLALIAGLAALSQTIRWVRILPGIPFAPGHKHLILLPLYILAAAATRTPWGATILGTTTGIVAFSFGDGQFGPLEILKFLAPGVVVDLVWPIARRRGAIAYAVVGFLAAVARFSAIAAVGWLVRAPAIFWAMLAPIGAFHLAFGTASGFITYHLLRSLGYESPHSRSNDNPWPESSEATESTEPTSKPS